MAGTSTSTERAASSAAAAPPLAANLPASPQESAAPWGGAAAAASAPASADSSAALSAQRAAESQAYDVTPAERPGLGTVFGETRHSSVQEVEFERQSDAPTFLASLHYNDAQGVSALRARLGSRYSSSEPMFRYFRAAPSQRPALWGGVTIAVVDESGRPLGAYHEGDHVLLVGETGQRYALAVENRTDQRFELVASVDGVRCAPRVRTPGRRELFFTKVFQ